MWTLVGFFHPWADLYYYHIYLYKQQSQYKHLETVQPSYHS